jgi:hypothetical protein
VSDDDLYSDVPESDESIKWVRRPTNTRTIRSSHAYKTAHDQYRIECMVRRQPDGSVGDPCCICVDGNGEPQRIDYGLAYPHPLSWSLEHHISVKDHPELLLEKNNWGSAHFACNSMKGPDELITNSDLGVPSEDWEAL